MAANHETITYRLTEVGACWAVSSAKCCLTGDGWGGSPCYHIHPDRAEPRESAILRFRSLRAIEEYIAARHLAAACPWRAHEIMTEVI